MNDNNRRPPSRQVADFLTEDLPGDPACLLRRVCQQCGSVADEDPPTVCPQCGAEMPGE
jgi:rubrerythrin